ncbi:hypothetical protein KCP78_00990 [Salmonella enterica subsp. enterica]|nr:hypothetical protein KCP78_00990 [Salmonella enterica subsp. enterica]
MTRAPLASTTASTNDKCVQRTEHGAYRLRRNLPVAAGVALSVGQCIAQAAVSRT